MKTLRIIILWQYSVRQNGSPKPLNSSLSTREPRCSLRPDKTLKESEWTVSTIGFISTMRVMFSGTKALGPLLFTSYEQQFRSAFANWRKVRKRSELGVPVAGSIFSKLRSGNNCCAFNEATGNGVDSFNRLSCHVTLYKHLKFYLSRPFFRSSSFLTLLLAGFCFAGN